MGEHLRQLGFGEKVSVERIRRGVLRYACGEARAIGKVYPDAEGGRRGFLAMQHLWQVGFCELEPAGVRIPRPHAYLPELRLLLMEEAPGGPLKKRLKQHRADPADLQFVGRALAKLHGLPPALGERVALEDHLRIRCAGLLEPLIQAFPDLATPAHRIVETAREAEASLDERCCVQAHGDFHLGQLHLDADKLWILDLDSLHRGDPAYDLAMISSTLKRAAGADDRRALWQAFRRGYANREDAAAWDRVPIQEALVHLKRACKRFRWQDEPGWPEAVRREVLEGARCLEA